VSRETLQQNAQIDAIKTALARRVIDMLSRMAADEPENYATFWREFGQVIKEGIVEDTQSADKLVRLLRFSTTHSASEKQDQSLVDYLSRAAEGQDKIYYLLAESHATASASPHLEQLRQKGLEVLLLTDRIDPWIVDQLPEFEGKKLHDVGRGNLAMPEGEGKISQEAGNDAHKPLLKKIKKVLKERVDAVNVSQRLVDSPACVIADEKDLTPQLRRMLEAAGQPLPESKPLLEINIEHPLVMRLSDETDERRFEALANVILDHAMLAEGTPLANPAAYVRRMNQLLLDIAAEKAPAGNQPDAA
ncbi:MAG TPA: molecular chaperone HtpG, partial [Woeseiaceae bacterium]